MSATRVCGAMANQNRRSANNGCGAVLIDRPVRIERLHVVGPFECFRFRAMLLAHPADHLRDRGVFGLIYPDSISANTSSDF